MSSEPCLYKTLVLESSTKRAFHYLIDLDEGILSIHPYDSSKLIILKKIAFKPSMLCFSLFALVEAVARCAISLISLLFSVLTLFSPHISEKLYSFSYDLMENNSAILGIAYGLFELIYGENKKK
jgi:hypothetical protein